MVSFESVYPSWKRLRGLKQNNPNQLAHLNWFKQDPFNRDWIEGWIASLRTHFVYQEEIQQRKS